MLLLGNMETVIYYKTFIPIGAMYLHARMFFTLTDSTSIPWVQRIYMQGCSVHLLIHLLYPWVQCIFMQEHSVHSLI